MIELLRELSAIPGVSGDEGRVAEYITDCIKDYCDYKIDPLGNILCHKKGQNPAQKTLLLSAHMDEVGMMVTSLTPEGLLKFAVIGGVDASVIAGRRVLVGPGRIPGVVGMKPIHLLESAEREKPLSADELTIDLGVADQDAARLLASPGDSVVFDTELEELSTGVLRGKALDDRAGCALLIRLIQSQLPCDCQFAFTVQEETGCAGGKTASFTLRPHLAIAVETTTAADIPGTPPEKRVCALGKGPVLSFMDRGTVYDRELFDQALALARREGIPCQVKEGVYGGNESRSVQTAAGGCRVLAVSLPCRYLHSPSCVLDTMDLEDAYRLLLGLIGAFAG